MNNIIFCDIEASIKTKKINEVGLVYKNSNFKTSSIEEAKKFISICKTDFISGHNFIDFDLNILKYSSLYKDIVNYKIIDTLPLSLLLFNEKTIHSLPKNYKNEDDFDNNPVEDSKITAILFDKLLERFNEIPNDTKNIFYSLLKNNQYFSGFFEYICLSTKLIDLNFEDLFNLIKNKHNKTIVNFEYLKDVLISNKVELAYILALLTPYIEIKAHPPKILFSYPNIVEIQKKLCFDRELSNKILSDFSKEVFGFGTFREFPRLNANILDNPSISQREIVEASLRDESFLAILPTGGGKTFTFWLPAIFKSNSYKGLTVVISPLQALIEDHIKSFNLKVANYKAVAISGFMSPLERSEAVEQVVNGEADILYIAPESLRSNTIFNILKNRLIERFVIDEAHCLSTWGNDFRQDYYYICEFIKDLLDKKNFQNHIPISCFTATGKPSVIKDIENYFLEGLSIKLDKYLAVPERKNLKYKSIPSSGKYKYLELLKLINEHDGATLVYIPTSTKNCDEIANKIAMDTNKIVKSFHSKIESQEKMQILKDYIENRVDIIVATTAFGMGVDKANITNVIHYEISDSLENYAQEAGRGARDENFEAYCPILFDEDDLDKHFVSLNRSKLTASEINSIFLVIKRSKGNAINKTAFELAKDAGWDVEDKSSDYSTKVKTALLELEREGYISRKRNKTNFFADSIVSKSMEKLHIKLKESFYSEEEKQRLILVLQNIIGRGKPEAVQVDELAHILGYTKNEISLAINQLKQLELLGDSKDLSLEISIYSLNKFKKIKEIELVLFNYLELLNSSRVRIRELNEELNKKELTTKNESELIKSIIKNWRSKSNFIFSRQNREQDLWYFKFENLQNLKDRIHKNHIISEKTLSILTKDLNNKQKEEIVISLKILHDSMNKEYDIEEIDKALLYLHHLNILELLKGRFINYSPMIIEKEEKFQTKRKYTNNEYKNRLEQHYQTKIESIHIMGEYAKRLKDDDHKAILFLRDYFTLSYENFKDKYKLSKEKISKPITQKRYNKIFEKMSEEQKEIINDKDTKAMMILAGPGSGKTKVLVHKIASLILTEDIKPEQFMMLTFSKSAKMEFKTRLNSLIGALSYDVEIQTFHSYALKLIARVANKENKIILENAIEEATRQINEKEITLPHITILVLDEFQDINEKSFEFVKAIYKATNEDIKIIAVGDDDQCIMDFNGAQVNFIDKYKKEFGYDEDGNEVYKQYELLCNFRSKKDIVNYSNDFITKVTKRYKTKPLYSNSLDSGSINIYSFLSKNMIIPLIELVKQEKSISNIAILVKTNEMVLDIYSILQDNNIDARYLIERDKFELKNIIELIEFDKVLNSYLEEEISYKEIYFEKALKFTESKFKNSVNISLLHKIIDKFLNESDSYKISEWISYLEEIRLEDFEIYNKNIIISTIHKSKGLEFDKVYLLVDGNPINDEEKRLFYVGMTRAKDELNIFRNGRDISNKKDYIKYFYDEQQYLIESKTFTHVMSLEDLNLGFDYEKFVVNNSLISGVKLTIEKKENFKNLCLIFENKIVATLSSRFNLLILEKFEKGYLFKDCIVEYIVLWEDKNLNKVLKHPLCKIIMQKNIIT
ncbi:RecQ family ATP-dependent DNA helicase [Aliarcobacter cibarius]|uniref:DNA 3'-5' helicase n=1 Tax=Aliarcobacter cibarius TaxID=255507 RepID=A0A7L5JMC6_9BACT|nr:RecQ family ATP-dependent DNA helicase [Aliarcobacter cibarius]QKJ26280.1 RecQ family ATP-dependent DNA helicase [Aliarcobacter cibarius]TLT02715.1 RecQ family ATP-dependent DNA helicase [Aliarcobacter cibarius]